MLEYPPSILAASCIELSSPTSSIPANCWESFGINENALRDCSAELSEFRVQVLQAMSEGVMWIGAAERRPS
jgi:hypothetical protein